MAETPPPRRSGAELDMALNNARQTITLLRTQAQAGKIDAKFFEERLGAIEKLMGEVAEQRKVSLQQERLAKLYQVSRVIGSSLDLQTVLDQVMDSLIELTGAERGFLMLLDDDGNLNVKVARNFDQETVEPSAFALSRTVTGNVLSSGQAVVTTNAQEDPRFSGQMSVISNQLRSIMASPLRTRGRIIGVAYVDNRVRAGLFSESDLDVLDAFATQAAVAIENARLFSATDQALSARVDELTTLQRIDRQLNETLDTAKAMATTLEWASRFCEARGAAMCLVDPQEHLLRIVSRYGETDPFSNEMTVPLDHRLVKQAVESQLPAVEKPEGSENVTLVVPVRRENRVVGVIAMSAPHQFKEESRALALRVADRAAIAIENARLYGAVQAANIAKSEFVGIVAHELKVPMTSIQGYADLMGMAGPLNDKQGQFLLTIKNSVNKMKVLVSDLSDISRIESGQLRIDLDDVNVVEGINAAVEGIITEIEKRKHNLQLDVEPELPRVRADLSRLTQVLLNLLSNAYKYSPDSSTITVRALRQEKHVLISVEDTGIGLTREQLAKLGTKFWRGENNLQQSGTGLGFAITRNLIELMSGKLDIESEPGQGSKFRFTLPIV